MVLLGVEAQLASTHVLAVERVATAKLPDQEAATASCGEGRCVAPSFTSEASLTRDAVCSR